MGKTRKVSMNQNSAAYLHRPSLCLSPTIFFSTAIGLAGNLFLSSQIIWRSKNDRCQFFHSPNWKRIDFKQNNTCCKRYQTFTIIFTYRNLCLAVKSFSMCDVSHPKRFLSCAKSVISPTSLLECSLIRC